jgi:hypothetical protein
MGGYGSTRWGWRSTRATTDEFPALDVRALARRGYFSAGPGHVAGGVEIWSSRGSEVGRIGVVFRGNDPHIITLEYQVRRTGEEGDTIRERVGLDRTRCTFGGRGHGLFALVVAHGARCSFVSVGCFDAGSAMILPIARRESHRVSEYGGMVASSADLLKRIHQAT